MKILNVIFIINFVLIINCEKAQECGCTDPIAVNYNRSATINDGSCTYNEGHIALISSFNLEGSISETSGLIYWNNQIWTHNDNGDINIYSLGTNNGNVIQSYSIIGTVNTDWEEISQDDEYIYIGDFGNNVNGNRTDLKILRIDKNSILTNSALVDTISFSYSDQINFASLGPNNSDFDCEAFIVSSDSIFLFTKQWVSNKTSIYSVSKDPGNYIAHLRSTFNVAGLITGATYLESQKLIVLCGYSNFVEPFIYLLYDFNGTDYFSGNKRKIAISLPFHQIEGIATSNGLKYYISNENLTQPPYIKIPQKLHILDLTPFLGDYLNMLITGSNTYKK
jgi:hypothetical protein